jgi:hypothetical protein
MKQELFNVSCASMSNRSVTPGGRLNLSTRKTARFNEVGVAAVWRAMKPNSHSTFVYVIAGFHDESVV